MSNSSASSAVSPASFVDLSWVQRDFGEHLEALSGLVGRKIDFRVRCNPVKSARLTDEHLHEIRQMAIAVPLNARHAFDEGKIDLNALPEKACVAFPGRTPEGLRDLVFMATVRSLPESVGGLEVLLESNRPIYRLHYLMFKDKGQIMGFTAYFGLDEAGEALFGSLGRFRFEDHPNGQEARQAVLRALRASQHMNDAPVLKAEGLKPALSIEATPEILSEAEAIGNAIKLGLVNLKKEDLKHPFAWLAGKMKVSLEASIEKKGGAHQDVPVVSVKVGAVTFSSK